MDFDDGHVMFQNEHEIPELCDRGILVINEYPDHTECASLSPDNGEGVSGNLDSHVRRYHGWRGTTNGIGVYAHGVRTVIARRTTRKTIVVTYGPDEATDKA